MPDAVHGRLAWPDGLDEATFLADVWQRRPLLMRAALPGFETPLPADELAGLSLEEDVTPRLLLEDDDGFRVEHGPFDAARFDALPERYSLLVSDVEKHLPELQAWLRPFRFVPGWRFDDLMVSYAPDGGSVGAHVDAYDVFLLQASGTRRWSIDTHRRAGRRTVTRGDLQLVDPFEPSETWTLEPGDILYLPPGVPHHGVAVGDDCTTWSIGFRAPSAAEIVAGTVALLADELDAVPLPDPPLRPGTAGRMAPESLRALKSAFERALRLDDEDFAQLAGRVLTTTRFEHDAAAGDAWDDAGAPGDDTALERWSFARFAWVDAADGAATLFADGRALRCSRALAACLCDPDAPLPARETLDPVDRAAFDELLRAGSLRAAD